MKACRLRQDIDSGDLCHREIVGFTGITRLSEIHVQT
jgi:hypothetical protein